MSQNKLWGGRFEVPTDRWVEEFSSSIAVDRRLWEVDIRGSIAHARMLGKCGVLSSKESQLLISGLESVRDELAQGKISLRSDAEDIHSEVERLLNEKIGAVSGKLHTARSRNDQVATDTRLYLIEKMDALKQEIQALQLWLVQTAEQSLQVVLPGLTHMQHAQPVSLGHHLMAYFWMLERDVGRLADCRKRTSSLPLGSAALAGTSFPLDRSQVALELGFETICENSLDAVSDRDFVVEFLSAAALMMMHLSRMAEEIVLWSMPEFGFIELSDAVTTGSSIMPQKKNPDVAELIRGRVGRVYGGLMGSLTLLKALPLSYHRDLQEDKVHLFEGLDSVEACVRLMHRMLIDARFQPERMAKHVEGDFSNATDLADYLVRKGIPFRQCHEIVGKMVRYCLQNQLSLEKLSLEEMRKFSSEFDESVLTCIQPLAVMEARKSRGGTSSESVLFQIQAAKKRLEPVQAIH